MNNIDKLLSYFYYGDNVKEIDFSNKEDVAKLKELLESLKSDVNPFSKFFLESIFGVSMEDLAEEVNKLVDKCVEAKEKEEKEKEEKEENPHKENFKHIIDDYMKEEVLTRLNLDKNMANNMKNALYDYTCWLYNR